MFSRYDLPFFSSKNQIQMNFVLLCIFNSVLVEYLYMKNFLSYLNSSLIHHTITYWIIVSILKLILLSKTNNSNNVALITIIYPIWRKRLLRKERFLRVKIILLWMRINKVSQSIVAVACNEYCVSLWKD